MVIWNNIIYEDVIDRNRKYYDTTTTNYLCVIQYVGAEMIHAFITKQ